MIHLPNTKSTKSVLTCPESRFVFQNISGAQALNEGVKGEGHEEEEDEEDEEKVGGMTTAESDNSEEEEEEDEMERKQRGKLEWNSSSMMY